MGKIIDFAISYDTDRVVYYPGDSITGNVILNLKEPMDMRALRVSFKGEAFCEWKEFCQQKSNVNKMPLDLKNKELIIKETRCLFGTLVGDGDLIYSHPDGKHFYSFSFILPPHVPSSFEGRFGHIRYIIKASIVKPWKFNHKVKRPVIINEIIDSNLAMYAAGVGGDKNKDVGCACGSIGGPLDMTAHIDRTCYCPGESILINANVLNLTSRNMHSLQTKLVQTVTYHTNTKDKIDAKTIAKLKGPPVDKGEYAAWTKQPLEIPATSPTIKSSRVITVDYKLLILVGVSYSSDPVIELPVVIGTVPYIPTYEKAIEYGTSGSELSQSIRNNLTSPASQLSIFGYPDMAPPSYSSVIGESSVSIKGERDEYTYGELQYNPLYTFAKPCNTDSDIS